MGLSELIDHASRDHGLVTLADAAACGVSRKQVWRLAQEGVLVRRQRGLYQMGGFAPDWVARVATGLLAAGSAAVASHQTALALHGIDRLPRPAIPHVLIEDTTLLRTDKAIVHRTRRLEDVDVTTAMGLRCTTGARTCIDLARTLPPQELVALVDDVIAARKSSRRLLHQRASELRAGRPALSTILAVTHPEADGEFWSWLERTFGHLVKSAGLPAPLFNAELPGVPGVFVDALWPNAPLVVELDGLRFHGAPSQQRKDQARANRISLAGYPVLRYSWQDVTSEPGRVVREIGRALHEPRQPVPK